MSLTNPKNVVTEERLSEFYGEILPYLGGMPEVLANKFSKGDLYSTDEKIIGCWTDGKPLYQKTYNYASSIVIPADNTSVKVKIADTTSLNISDLISIKGSALSSGGNQLRPIPDVAPVGNEGNYWMLSSCYVDDLDKGLYIASRRTNNTSVTLTNVKLTIQYTKTTDAANSFKYGNETDYSTEEKIVGTWIDGKPIYQKVINCGALPNTSQKNISTGISNPKMLIDAWGCCTNDTSTAQLIIPRILKDNQDVMVSYAPNLSEVRIKTESNRSTLNCYFFLRYTKTTD